MTKENKPGHTVKASAALLRKLAEDVVNAKAPQLLENLDVMSPDEVRQILHELRVHQIELEMQNEELRRAQEDLDEAGQRYFDLYNLAPVGYITMSKKGLILEANLTAATLLGVARSALVKQPLSRFIFPEAQDIYYLQRKHLFDAHSTGSGQTHVAGSGQAHSADSPNSPQAGSGQTCELRMLKKDGTTFWARLEATAVKDADGVPVYRTVISDITLRKQMEADLLCAQKLESLGVLAGGIAHDFNNLMAAVQGYIGLALIALPAGHGVCEKLHNAMHSIDQTKDLTSKLITFSGGGGSHKEIFDVAKILRDAVQSKTKETEVQITFDLMENLWKAEVDELQLRQCFYNLTTNAVEAMPKGGKLKIEAENVLMPASEVIDLKAGYYLKIKFADKGTGIAEGLLPRIFDPYFTTKEMGAQKGAGLGLAVCYAVLENHNGHIAVESSPGKGAAFVLYLPAQPELAKAPAMRIRDRMPEGKEKMNNQYLTLNVQ